GPKLSTTRFALMVSTNVSKGISVVSVSTASVLTTCPSSSVAVVAGTFSRVQPVENVPLAALSHTCKPSALMTSLHAPGQGSLSGEKITKRSLTACGGWAGRGRALKDGEKTSVRPGFVTRVSSWLRETVTCPPASSTVTVLGAAGGGRGAYGTSTGSGCMEAYCGTGCVRSKVG